MPRFLYVWMLHAVYLGLVLLGARGRDWCGGKVLARCGGLRAASCGLRRCDAAIGTRVRGTLNCAQPETQFQDLRSRIMTRHQDHGEQPATLSGKWKPATLSGKWKCSTSRRTSVSLGALTGGRTVCGACGRASSQATYHNVSTIPFNNPHTSRFHIFFHSSNYHLAVPLPTL